MLFFQGEKKRRKEKRREAKGTGESDSDSFEKIRKEDGGINHMG